MIAALRKLLLAAATTMLAAFGTPSHAVLISATTNNPYFFSWSFDTGTSLLTGSGLMTLAGFNSNTLAVTVTLNNTSQITGQGGERLVGFAFGIDPNASWIGFSDANDGGLWSASWANGALAANVPGVEICAYGGSNCSGGSNGGIYAGNNDTFTILLGGNWGSQVNIDPIGLRYQTGYGSFTFPSTSSSGQVPEPASAGLAGLGLALIGVSLWRRRRQALAG
jgi:hypothetical protein